MIVTKKDGLYLGHPNVWSDWSLHIGIANIFAYKDPSFWLSYHPLFAGGKFTYPFVMDMISGLMMRVGIPLDLAFFIPSVFFVFILIFSLYCLFFLLSKSKLAAVLAINFYFFSSGFGFLSFINDFLRSPNINLFLHPIKEYSRFNNYQWYTGNVIVGLLIPQRSFLMGLSLGTLCLALLIFALTQNSIKYRYKKYILSTCGIIAGLLPIIHPHTFIFITLVGGILSLLYIKKNRELIFFIIPAGIISSVLYIKFLMGGIQNSSFFTILPGWTSHGPIDFIYMWIVLWGIAIPLSIISFLIFFRQSNKAIKGFFCSTLIVFLMANLIIFQPIVWDNTKLFWWVYVGISALCAAAISKLLSKKLIYKIIGVIMIILLTFTGILELIKFVDFPHNTYQITSTSDIRLGEAIRNSTSPLDLFVTAPKHNTLVMMWAQRPILLGYTAWVLNFGFNYQQRERDLYTIYQGGEQSSKLLKYYGVKYVLIGPSELIELHANESYFASHFPLAFSNEANKVYKITH